jgi:hypothetical protein
MTDFEYLEADVKYLTEDFDKLKETCRILSETIEKMKTQFDQEISDLRNELNFLNDK